MAGDASTTTGFMALTGGEMPVAVGLLNLGRSRITDWLKLEGNCNSVKCRGCGSKHSSSAGRTEMRNTQHAPGTNQDAASLCLCTRCRSTIHAGPPLSPLYNNNLQFLEIPPHPETDTDSLRRARASRCPPKRTSGGVMAQQSHRRDICRDSVCCASHRPRFT